MKESTAMKIRRERERLLLASINLLQSMREREKLSFEIQKMKKKQGRFSRWLPKREKEVFKILAPYLEACSLKELLAFSLIMESQAQGEKDSYPSWSLDSEDLIEYINPLLRTLAYSKLGSCDKKMPMEKYDSVIAIDGPSGSGKSTVARKLSERLGALYIDTGAMFRGLAIFLERDGVDLSNKLEVESKLKKIDFIYGKSQDNLIEINGENLTQKIREHRVSQLASEVSQVPTVRAYLATFQRGLAKKRLCIMEGRDIGTVIFPRAFLKVFLTASSEIRAKRRFEELQLKGEKVLEAEVLEDILKRDLADSQRAEAPLKKAEDAILCDTTGLELEEVLDCLEKLYKLARRSKVKNKYEEC